MFLDSLSRLKELSVLALRESNNSNSCYFFDFENEIENNPLMQSKFKLYNQFFDSMDKESWEFFSKNVLQKCCEKKEISYIENNEEKDLDIGWIKLTDLFSEAAGYFYLKESNYLNIEFIPTSNNKTPDLKACKNNLHCILEVKKINKSEIENIRIHNRELSDSNDDINDKLTNKIHTVINKAIEQLSTYDKNNNHKHFVFLHLDFDGYIEYQNKTRIDYLEEEIRNRNYNLCIILFSIVINEIYIREIMSN